MFNVREVVFELFETNVGIISEDYEQIMLKDLYMESLAFINFIVDIERTLNISLPEEYLVINELPDLMTFSAIVENLYNEQHKEIQI